MSLENHKYFLKVQPLCIYGKTFHSAHISVLKDLLACCNILILIVVFSFNASRKSS